MIITRLTLALALTLVLFGHLVVSPAPAAVAQACSWAGTWDTGSYGTLELTQNGNAVSGTYAYNGMSGKLSGNTEGIPNALGGDWTEDPAPEGKGVGKFVFFMAADCNSFDGAYGYGTTTDAEPAGEWAGKRVK